MPGKYCPLAEVCYCRQYGLCDLECSGPGKCNDKWEIHDDKIPEGWPEIGFDGKPQNITALYEID